MTITQRAAVVIVFAFILAIYFAMSGRKKIVITEARAEADAQVIGEYVSTGAVTQAVWPDEFEQEPRGM